MKKIFISILIINLILIVFSCKKDNKEAIDFFKLEDRIGKWVNDDRGDTLEFINDTILNRYHGEEDTFRYRINNNSMYIRLRNSKIETQHDIIEWNDNKVKLNNMYIGFEETINYGIFNKLID